MPHIFEQVTGSDGALSFQFNGQFALKNYNVEIVNGNRLRVVSNTNEMFSLLEAEVSEVEINGQIYSDANAAQLALQTLVYSNAKPVVLTEEMYLKLASAVQAADRGQILPDTSIPAGGWQVGWYTAGLSSPAPGTNYPNQNDLKADEDYTTKFYFNGTGWVAQKDKMPKAQNFIPSFTGSTFPLVSTSQNPIQRIHEDSIWMLTPGQTVSSTDVPGVSDKWVSIGDTLELDEVGGALSYDTFSVMASVLDTTPLIFDKDAFTVVGGYGENDANMAFHSDYTGSRSTAKILVKKDDVIEIKSMTNNASLPTKVPVLTILGLDQTTILKTVVNQNSNVIQTQMYTAQQDCYIVGSVASTSFLPQVELKITSSQFALPTTLLSDLNYKDFTPEIDLDVTGGAVGYDGFIEMIKTTNASTPDLELDGDDFTIVGTYGDNDANMTFHSEYDTGRTTGKIFVDKGDIIEITSMTNNVNLPTKIPVLVVFGLNQTTILESLANTASNTIQTQTFTASQDCYVVGVVAHHSYLPQVKLKVTKPTFTIPTKLLTDENFTDYVKTKTIKERIINGDTPDLLKGISGTRQEITLLKYKDKNLIYYGKGWGDEQIYVADYNIDTNTASNEQVIINASTTGINATNFKCPTAFVCENKVYLVFSANAPQTVCALYESTNGKTFTQVSTTIANVTGFHNTRFGNHYIVPYRIDGFYYWFIEGVGPDGWWIMKLMKSQSITSGWQDMGEITGLSPTNGARGGACVHYQDGKFKMIYHYSPVFSNLPTYIGYAEADFNNPLYFKQLYAPVTPITKIPWPGLTDQFADPDLVEIDGRTFLFCSVVNNSQGLSEIWRWECDGRLSDILNSKI